MQIRNIQTKFKAFEYKLEYLEWDSNHSNTNSNKLNANYNHSKKIQSIRM